MSGQPDPERDARTLRQQAEAQAHDRVNSVEHVSDADAHRLVHELQVHEIELAMQNEQLRASQADVESLRARYTDLFDFAPTGYLTLSRDCTINDANLKAGSLLHTNRAALLRQPFASFVSRADRHAFESCCASAFSDTRRAQCELELVGGNVPFQYVHFEAVANEARTELRVSLVDITDRRAAEAQLQLRDRAMHAVPHGIVITDALLPDNPIVYVNPGFELMSGYAAAEAMGRNCRFMQGPDTDPAAVRTIRDAIRAGVPCDVELLNYTSSAEPYWLHLAITPVHDRDGRLVQFVGVQVDISERRQMQRELQQAQRMEVVGRLAGGIAHDFNNLLTVINGYTDVLQSELPPDDPLREAAAHIGQAGARAASLTGQLLAFSRRQVMTMKVLDLNLLIDETTAMLRRLINEDIDLRVDLHHEPAYVSADAAQLGQVLMNLVLNACDAMAHGGTLAIRATSALVDDAYRAAHNDVADLYHTTRREMRTGQYIVLTVSDTGIGMDAGTAARVFEPFFSTKGVGKGTGLGLSLVYGVVKQSDGYITVDSEVDRGTEFSIYLPAAEHAPPASPSLAAPTNDLTRNSETILLVEDEPSVRSLASRMLRESGYNVIAAGGAAEALRLAAAYIGQIDLLVADVVMPEIGGRALADSLQQSRPTVRVLFMSGYPDDEVLRRGVQQDRAAFLAKPFSYGNLARKVRETLNASPGPR